MLGLMQDQPLLISSLIDFADKHHGGGEVVSRRVEGDIHRYAWSDVAKRSRQVANALDGMKLAFFHVNAWGIPYSAALTGAKLVFPGPGMDGKSVYEMIENEGVTYAAGVPTV